MSTQTNKKEMSTKTVQQQAIEMFYFSPEDYVHLLGLAELVMGPVYYNPRNTKHSEELYELVSESRKCCETLEDYETLIVLIKIQTLMGQGLAKESFKTTKIYKSLEMKCLPYLKN